MTAVLVLVAIRAMVVLTSAAAYEYDKYLSRQLGRHAPRTRGPEIAYYAVDAVLLVASLWLLLAPEPTMVRLSALT